MDASSFSSQLTGKCKVLVTRVSPLNLEFYRSDLRLLIHYEYSNIDLENYYRECLLAGLDGNPSKCIIFKKFECLRLEQITPKDTLRTYLNIKDCRRKLTLRHFGSIERFPTLESCCDNCQTILNDKIPPFKIYKDIDEKGFLNISVDARILMKLINAYKGKGFKYPIDFLVGDVPKKKKTF
ncbi:CLUMA_CG001583, isoform A [Clunio marinus]|uniref:CLUMA_CG001583, isoform A n=1 Tax=Clunio marinus TaxID=568069 RepID=A0A1J1HIC4_9DIPT|nr:CLUMA_CG001583, isoform A [Clunio marinus]